MLPLIPLAISLAPEIGKFLFGDTQAVANTTAAVQAVVSSVTGTQDAAAQMAMIERSPEAASALRVQLARVAAEAEAAAAKADADQRAAQLADVAGARATTLSLVHEGSAVAWGAPVVSVVVLVSFGTVMALALTRTVPSGSEALLNVLLGSLAAMATSVVSYWVGSSAGSAAKTAQLVRLASRG